MKRDLLPLAVLLASLCAAGCAEQLSPEAQRLLTAGKASYQSGPRNDAATIATMTEFLAGNPKSRRADEAYYWRGLARYRSGALAGAKSDFNQTLSRTDNNDLKGRSLKALGDMAFDADDSAVAESMYHQSLVFLDDAKPPVDEVRYRLGQTFQRLGMWAEADKQFSRLGYRFPDGVLSRQAARFIHCTAWTIQICALKSKRSADAMARQARGKLKQDPFVSVVPGQDELLMAVRVGRYALYEQALADLAAAKAQFSDAYVTVTK